jgi:hypothetical protein
MQPLKEYLSFFDPFFLILHYISIHFDAFSQATEGKAKFDCAFDVF